MDTTKRLFNIYTWNMINHEFLLGVGVLSKIQTNPDGCVWTWGIPHFFGLLNYKQVTIHHHLPSITNGFSNQKNNIKKKKKHHPSPEFVGHATLPSHRLPQLHWLHPWPLPSSCALSPRGNLCCWGNVYYIIIIWLLLYMFIYIYIQLNYIV